MPEVQENERVEVPPTHSPLSEEQFQDLSALYPLQRTLHSSVHAVDVFQEVLDYTICYGYYPIIFYCVHVVCVCVQ